MKRIIHCLTFCIFGSERNLWIETWLTSDDWILCKVPPSRTAVIESRTVGSKVKLNRNQKKKTYENSYNTLDYSERIIVISLTNSGNRKRPPSQLRARTTDKPPKSRVPLMQMVNTVPYMSVLWMASVHTTALSPPCWDYFEGFFKMGWNGTEGRQTGSQTIYIPHKCRKCTPNRLSEWSHVHPGHSLDWRLRPARKRQPVNTISITIKSERERER